MVRNKVASKKKNDFYHTLLSLLLNEHVNFASGLDYLFVFNTTVKAFNLQYIEYSFFRCNNHNVIK